ncbi:hypothetical protein ILYODFUR_011130 [Ilyodon furcidens]|uniref:Uncharacterized protein n=1 Tax=Ilyodon furcidens TaxID=33524 RepID=A0ABV0U5I2_9TELE
MLCLIQILKFSYQGVSLSINNVSNAHVAASSDKQKQNYHQTPVSTKLERLQQLSVLSFLPTDLRVFCQVRLSKPAPTRTGEPSKALTWCDKGSSNLKIKHG